MNTTEVILRALEDGKGADIKMFAAAGQSGGMFERAVIATANSPRHAAALAERVRRALKTAELPRG
ncbi:MAG: RsfS/YbeB/iojap family protein, partial [Betaproteobacteria bacterium]|nr:RsfS/YbeB/iojap family protein [Betaproteobacteria bacterium]